MREFGQMHITGNSTAMIAAAAGTKITTGWAAGAADSHGSGAVGVDTTNGELDLQPGRRYLVLANLTVETEDISGTSGDDAGDVTFQLHKAGTLVAGSKAKVNAQDSDRPTNVSISQVIEVAADAEGNTTALSIYAVATDASGNDITVSEAQFVAIALD